MAATDPSPGAKPVDAQIPIPIENRVDRLERERLFLMKLAYKVSVEFARYCERTYGFRPPLNTS